MNFKKTLPHLIAIAVFLSVSLIYFAPLLSGKKEIYQSDVNQYKGVSREIVEFRAANNSEEPLWTNAIFCGMPAYQVSVIYAGNLMKYVDKVFLLGLPFHAGYVFLYFLGFYILLMCLRVDPGIAVIGSLAYGFSSFFFIILEVGHNTQAHAIAYMAPLLGSVILTYRGNLVLGATLTALFTALELYSNHLQITYYLLMIVLVVVLVELYNAAREKRIGAFVKRSAVALLAAMIGVLPNITSLWTTYEYGKYSNRGNSELTIGVNGKSNAGIKTSGLDKDYATQWSYGKSETFTLLIPDFKGGASELFSSEKKALEAIPDPQMRNAVAGTVTTYFGDQEFTSGPVYVGAIVIFLALMGMMLIRDNIRWALLMITVLAVPLSWGKNLMSFSNFFFDYVPGYNKFRSVTMILVIAELTIPLLAALSLNRLITLQGNSKLPPGKELYVNKAVLIAAGTTAGFALLCWLVPNMFNTFQAEGELNTLLGRIRQQAPDFSPVQAASILDNAELARKSLFRSDALRTAVLILLAAGVLWLYLKQKLRQRSLVVLLAVLILCDMWPVAARYLNKSDYVSAKRAGPVVAKSKADEIILSDSSGNYRVLNLTVNPFLDGMTSYWHESIGGYHGAKLKSYSELTDFYMNSNISAVMRVLRKNGISDSSLKEAFEEAQVLNMLNTKYVILDKDARPLPNPVANGNAWFVTNIRFTSTANEEILELGKINTKNEAVVNAMYEGQLKPVQKTGNGAIRLQHRQPNQLLYEAEVSAPRLAVFSEIWYPKGWKATIDGEEVPIIKADYLLRALLIPAGKHRVEFVFKPESFYTGEKISLAGSVLVILIALAAIIHSIRKHMA